jgi:hypothetical protein
VLSRGLSTCIHGEVNGIYGCKGSVGGMGREEWLGYIRWVLKNSIEDSVGGYCVVIINMIAGSSFNVNMELFHCIEMMALFLVL